VVDIGQGGGWLNMLKADVKDYVVSKLSHGQTHRQCKGLVMIKMCA